MAVSLAQALAWTSILVTAIIYVGAVAGVLFHEATPPLDVGALSVLGTGLAFGAFGLLVSRQPA